MPYTHEDDDNISSLADYSDVELISEMEMRGYVVHDEDYAHPNEGMAEAAQKLYLDYMLLGGEFFDKELRKFFNKYLNKTLR